MNEYNGLHVAELFSNIQKDLSDQIPSLAVRTYLNLTLKN